MNKIKLLLPLFLTSGLATAITSCSSNQEKTKLVTLELSKAVKDKGVSIISSNIQYGKNSYMILGLPEGKLISDVAIKTDTSNLNKKHVIIKDNEITIPADKMNCDKIVLNNITLEDQPVPDVPVDFLTCSWSELDKWCQKLESNGIDVDTFCKHFLINNNPVSSLDEFIGLERQIQINSISHTIRIVATQHDTIDQEGLAGAKAVFSFELVTLLSDSNGNALHTVQHNTPHTHDYLNCVLRANIGSGNGEKTWDKTAIEMLEDENTGEPELSKVIKSTTHYVVTSESWRTIPYIETEYSDKLYIPAYGNITVVDSQYCRETKNLEFAYYNNIESQGEEAVDTARIKKDANGNDAFYWLGSPYTKYINNQWGVNTDGKPNSFGNQLEDGAVSFAFCI